MLQIPLRPQFLITFHLTDELHVIDFIVIILTGRRTREKGRTVFSRGFGCDQFRWLESRETDARRRRRSQQVRSTQSQDLQNNCKFDIYTLKNCIVNVYSFFSRPLLTYLLSSCSMNLMNTSRTFQHGTLPCSNVVLSRFLRYLILFCDVLTVCTLQVINDKVSISYQLAAEGGGGIVSARDFVNLRYCTKHDGAYVCSGVF